MGWVFRNARESFDQYHEIWDEINRSQGNHILLDSRFIGPLIRHFASKTTLLGMSKDHKNPGMVLIEKVRKGFWQTFQPPQEPLGLILLGNRDDVKSQIRALIYDLPGYAVGFGILQQDSYFTVFNDLCKSQTIDILQYIDMPYLTVTGDFEEYWKGRGKYYANDLRRQRRRLAERGIQVEFVAERDPDRMAECIRRYGELEGKGWKGREGTAVTAENRQGFFYREMLENFCRQSEGVVYRLFFNGENVASNLCLERNGMLVMLKMTYDESFEGISPGKLIHQEILKSLFHERKIRVLEWYGRAHDWQIKLGGEVRSMYHVNFYRHPWVSVARRLFKATSRVSSSRRK